MILSYYKYNLTIIYWIKFFLIHYQSNLFFIFLFILSISTTKYNIQIIVSLIYFVLNKSRLNHHFINTPIFVFLQSLKSILQNSHEYINTLYTKYKIFSDKKRSWIKNLQNSRTEINYVLINQTRNQSTLH